MNLIRQTDVVAKYHKYRCGTNRPEGRPTHILVWLDILEKLVLEFMDHMFHKPILPPPTPVEVQVVEVTPQPSQSQPSQSQSQQPSQVAVGAEEEHIGETEEHLPRIATDEELDALLYQINLLIEGLALEILAIIQPLQANLLYMYQHNYYAISEDEALKVVQEFRDYVKDSGHGQAAGMLRRTAKLVDFVDNVRKICDFLLENTGYTEFGRSPRKILKMLQKNLESCVKAKRQSIY